MICENALPSVSGRSALYRRPPVPTVSAFSMVPSGLPPKPMAWMRTARALASATTSLTVRVLEVSRPLDRNTI